MTKGRDGGATLNPDEEVQERLRLVFAKFRDLRSAKAVIRYLRRGDLLLPVRPLHGPAPHDVVWRPANSARVIHILRNPAYAGAYVYGRRRPDPMRRQPGSGRIGTITVAPEDWSICLKDAHPAYVEWNEFMANQRQLADNLNHYDKDRRGVPRNGRALLQGIVSCGRCACRMCLRYSGPNGDHPAYMCVADKVPRDSRDGYSVQGAAEILGTRRRPYSTGCARGRCRDSSLRRACRGKFLCRQSS
jgi:hypothetical protein